MKPTHDPLNETVRLSANMLADKKILLVDDDRKNRLVTATILKKYDAIVMEAVNGQEAIDILKDIVVDLVLMDVEMPVMDGMEATGVIRKNISTAIPVIAFTANDFPGDNDKCIDAGMNAYLSKPFKEKGLLDIVTFWLNKNHVAVSITSSRQVASNELYNLSDIVELSSGNDGFVEKMVNMFIAQTPLQVTQMEESFLRDDYQAMGGLAHSIKPVIDNLGILSLKHVIREIEKKGKQEIKDPEIIVLISHVKNTIGLVVTDLKRKFPESRKD
jgi:CheY-like chemotaxis protein/HPt (histidine-containing phosphotransfer) domain-containing protein